MKLAVCLVTLATLLLSFCGYFQGVRSYDLQPRRPQPIRWLQLFAEQQGKKSIGKSRCEYYHDTTAVPGRHQVSVELPGWTFHCSSHLTYFIDAFCQKIHLLVDLPWLEPSLGDDGTCRMKFSLTTRSQSHKHNPAADALVKDKPIDPSSCIVLAFSRMRECFDILEDAPRECVCLPPFPSLSLIRRFTVRWLTVERIRSKLRAKITKASFRFSSLRSLFRLA